MQIWSSSAEGIGSAVAVADVNGDGIKDIIVTAYGAAGKVIVVYGVTGTTRGDVDVASIAVGTGYKVLGAILNDNLGYSVAAGDFNGDSIAGMYHVIRD